MAGVDMLHVPYRGGGPALADMLGGQVQAYMPTLVSAIEHVRAGKLRALAVTAATRANVLPDMPALGETVPGYDATSWWGIGVPKNTPSDIVEKLNKEINAGLSDPGMRRRISELGDTAFTSSPVEFARLVSGRPEKWGKVIKTAGIEAE